MGGRRNSSCFDGKRKMESEIDAEFLESIFDSNSTTSYHNPLKIRPASTRYLEFSFNDKQSGFQESKIDLTLPTIMDTAYTQENVGRVSTAATTRATSAKVYSAHQNQSNQSAEVKQRERRKLLQLQQQLTQGPNPNIKNNKKPVTTYKTDSASDEDFIRNASVMSSASSSISWAEDAVEAEFTEKLSSLWDEVDKVCSGQIEEKPEKMSHTIYEECLQWQRAFPEQDLSRFSKYKENDSTPTPTSARSRLAIELSQAITPLSIATPNFSPPDPRLQECVTPNPLTSSDYINSWLSECQNRSAEDLMENDEFSAEFFTFPSISTNAIEPAGYPLSTPKVRPKSTSTKRSMFSPDPNNFFTSLALSDTTNNSTRTFLNNEKAVYENEEQKSLTNGSLMGQVRVQRPISSHIRGHAITPISTGLIPQNSFRKSSASRGNPIPSTISSNSLPALTASNNSSSATQNNRTNDVRHNYASSASGRGSRGVGSNYANHTSKFNPGWSRYSGTSNDSGGDCELPYFETIAEDFSVDSVEPHFPVRPNTLDVPCNSDRKTSANPTNGPFFTAQSNTRDKQPAKPFFFWLLDRVSPN